MRLRIELLIIWGLIIFLSFLLITLSILKFNSGVEIDELGSYGDFFAGLIGPIINVIAALLVYKSFQAQVTANNIQTKALSEEAKRYKTDKDYDRIQNLIQDVKLSCDNLILEFSDDVTEPYFYNGESCIDEFLKFLTNAHRVSIPTYNIKNEVQYLKLYVLFLANIRFTSSYIIKFHDHKDDSFMLLKDKMLKLNIDLDKKLKQTRKVLPNWEIDKKIYNDLDNQIEMTVAKLNELNNLY